jgi:Fis family transcriptional regulator, factor for inversion stimulation protein
MSNIDMVEMNNVQTPTMEPNRLKDQPLRDSVFRSMQNYFEQLGDYPVSNLYKLVLEEVEVPLLKTVLTYTRGNQSKAARILGLSRGTLRKLLAQYGISGS